MNATPTPEQMRRMSAVTANFNGLKGLVLVPTGIWLIAYGAITAFAPRADLVVFISLPLVFVAMYLIELGYRKRYGRVRDRTFGPQMIVAAIALLTFVVTAFPVNILAFEGSPIWMHGLQAALIMAVMIMLPPLVRGRWSDLLLTRHWHVVCGVLAAIALLPIGLLTGGVHPFSTSFELSQASLMWALGTCFLIGGSLDHLILVRTLAPSPTEEG